MKVYKPHSCWVKLSPCSSVYGLRGKASPSVTGMHWAGQPDTRKHSLMVPDLREKPLRGLTLLYPVSVTGISLLFGSDGFSFVTELPVVFSTEEKLILKEVEQVEES